MYTFNLRNIVLQLTGGVVLAAIVYFVAPAMGVSALAWTYVYWGTEDRPVCEPWGSHPWQIDGWGTCWHKDEPSNDPWTGGPAFYSAIDYNGAPYDGWGDAGDRVEHWTNLGYNWLWGFSDIPDAWLGCKGVAAKTYYQDYFTGLWVYTGDFHYLHIDVDPGVVGLWTFSDVTDIGAVAATETCLWTAPHLHQSANTAYWTFVWSNWSRFDDWNDLSWQHKLLAPY